MLLLAALFAARAGFIDYAWEAARISPAFADGHRGSEHSGGGESSGGGEREGGSGSGGGGGYSGSGGGGSGGGGYSGSGGGDGGGQRGGDGYAGYGAGTGYSGYGSSGGYTGYGSSTSGYTYSGVGSPHPHSDGKPPSVGLPQPELKGLPKELRLDLGKDSKTWENLLKDNYGPHTGTKEAEHAGRDPAKGWTPVKGDDSPAPLKSDKSPAPVKGDKSPAPAKNGNSRAPGESGTPIAPDPRSYSRTEVLAANLSPQGAARARALGFQVGGAGQGAGGGHGPGGGQGPGGGHGLGPDPFTVLTLPPGMDPAQGMRLLQQQLPGEHFQNNNIYRLYQPAMKPATKQDGEGHAASIAVLGGKKCGGDRCYAQQAIQWNDRYSSCARNVKIGVINTGFDLQHPAFKNQKITQRNFLPASKSPASIWHGTGVLALLAGRPDSGTPGLAPEATYHAAAFSTLMRAATRSPIPSPS